MSKIREKESLECVRMHIWASKTQKLPGPLSGPWTPAAECSLRSRDSTSLRQQLSASEAGAPPLTKSWIRTWWEHDIYLSLNNILIDQKLSMECPALHDFCYNIRPKRFLFIKIIDSNVEKFGYSSKFFSNSIRMSELHTDFFCQGVIRHKFVMAMFSDMAFRFCFH